MIHMVIHCGEKAITPTKTSREAASGGAAAFLDFLEHEVIPFVDRTYRTISSDRGLVGQFLRGPGCDLRFGATAGTFSTDRSCKPRIELG
jgi:hypothetical protein